MADTPAATSGGELGERRLGTIHAVAQALAIGPMFSVALVLGGISRPDIGAGWNAALAVLLAGLGVMSIAYALSLFARKFAGAGAVYEYLTHGVASQPSASSRRASSSSARCSWAAAASIWASASWPTASGRSTSPPTTRPRGGSSG